jgi:2,4'-dihydroxyacetophenone dioxygenase
MADGQSKTGVPMLSALGVQDEIVAKAVPDDERVWVPQADNVWFRPLLMNTVSGG